MKFLIPLLLLWSFTLSGQETAPRLSAEEAVRMALGANFDIRLVRDDAVIGQLNNTKANAGMLPVVNLVGNENFTLSAFQQQLANGNEFRDAGAPFNNFNVGVQLNWTLFDGRRMYIAKQRLEALETLGQLNVQNQIQQTTAAVLQAYYEIARGRLQEQAIREVIDLNQERLRIAEARLAAGLAAQTDALQARIDVNQRRSDLIAQENTTATAKRNLNQLLARDPQTPFSVEENLTGNYAPNRDSLLAQLQRQNPALLSLQKNAAIATLQVSEAQTLTKPRINGIGQVNTLRTDNGAGFLRNNTQAGLTVGAGLIWPLYTGGNLRRQAAVAEVAAHQAVLRVDQQRLSLSRELDDQLAFFQTQQQVLALESENVVAARENLLVSTERFRVGQTNALEVQTVQNSLEQALFRRNLVQFNLKVIELRLRLLAGQL